MKIFIQKRIKIKQVAWFAVFIFLISIIPLMILSLYAYPSADDFGYGAACHQTWIQTHSVWQTIWQAVLTAKDRYFTWQGTFSSVFLFALQPAVWNESLYWITTLIMLTLMTFSIWCIMKAVLGKSFGADKYSVMIISAAVLFFMVQCMVDATQGLFWYNGATHYIVMHSLYLILTALQIGLLQKEKCHVPELFVSILLAFIVSGGNYITALLYGITTVTLSVAAILGKQCKRNLRLVLPFVVFMAGFILNIAAPGNAVRQGNFRETPGVLLSILISMTDCLQYVLGEWFDWRIILMMILVFPIVLRIVRNTSCRFRYPLLIVVYSYCCLSAMFTPTIYATGTIGAGRIHNIIYEMFLLLLVLNMVYVTGWLVQKEYLPEKEDDRSRKYFIQIMIVSLCVMGISAIIRPETFTSANACEIIMSGEAEDFYNVNMERKKLLTSMQNRDIKLPRYENFPALLYIDDVSTENDWRSNGMCRFYDKDSIVLEESREE